MTMQTTECLKKNVLIKLKTEAYNFHVNLAGNI